MRIVGLTSIGLYAAPTGSATSSSRPTIRPAATDLLFNKTYFAFEETGLGWPSFFPRQTYGDEESRKEAFLRLFADAYRVLPNRYMDESDAKRWACFEDTKRRVRPDVAT